MPNTQHFIDGPRAWQAAEWALNVYFRHQNHRTLWCWRENWYHWNGTRWIRHDERWLLRKLTQVLQRVQFTDGQGVTQELRPTQSKVKEVLALLDSQCQITLRVPGFTPGPNTTQETAEALQHREWAWCISFENLVVNVYGGSVRTFTRDHTWFDTCLVPVLYSEGAGCPRWMQALQEWSGGDPQWVTLLQRWMGYCLLPTRRYSRWMLLKGVPRSGKGTIARVISKLVEGGFRSTDLFTMTSPHGLMGLEDARVISITEAADLNSREGARASTVLKNVIGRDPIRINPKNRPIQELLVDAVVMMQSNQVVRLPNQGRGMSDKMLILPFQNSFLNHEDLTLEDQLLEELPGIAAWAVEGARQLAASPPGEWFPMTQAGLAEVQEYTLENNQVDQFLEDRFVRSPGFVSGGEIWDQWQDWLRTNHLRNIQVGRNQILRTLIRESTWDLRQVRRSQGNGLVGLGLRIGPSSAP